MHSNLKFLTYALLALLFATQFTSCSKDSDLLSDYVINEEFDALSRLVINDDFVVAPGETALLDVLSNDQFDNLENVSITGTSEPQNGTVNINDDNTLTYTADTTEEQPETTLDEGLPDTFEYTVEQTTDNGQTVAETGVVNINNKIPTSGANVFYVTTNGKSTNDGKSEQSSWDLVHAFKAAKAGDVIHVKAGNYGALQINTSRSGTADNPIKFYGYTNTPQDIIAFNGPTFDYEDWLANSNDLPDNIMPHMELNPSNNNPGRFDDAFDITHEYIEIHNFMISEYMIGIDVRASNVTINNVIGDQFGNWNPNAEGWNGGSSFANENNNGYGMNINGKGVTNCNITNNLIINAGHVSYFFVGGGNHLVNNNVGVAHDTGNGSDYIFDFYNSSNSIGNNNLAIRAYTGSTGHRGRSVIFQAQSDNNVFNNLESVNLRVQFENANNNIMDGLRIYTINGGSGENDGSIQVYAQADNNVVKNFSITGGGGISFLGTDSVGENPKPHNSAGENNYFINGKITGLNSSSGNAVINYHRLGGTNGISAGTNYLIGITATNFHFLVNANRNGNIQVYNSSFSDGKFNNIATYYPGWNDSRNNYNVDFYNTNFFNNNFSTPSGTNISTGNPLLNNNLEPQEGSVLINSGVDTRTLKEETSQDFNGKSRTLPYDIGAIEY